MKLLAGLLMASVFGLMFCAAPARAQFGGLPNQGAWDQYLSNHPKTAEELRANPSLIYNANWRRQHPHFETWANNHPKDWEMMRSPAPWQNRYGAWDSRTNEWHDQDWWHRNDPDWARKNHPDWWQEHKDWIEEKHEEHEEERAEHAEEKWEHKHHNEEGANEPGGNPHGHGHGHGHGHDSD